MASWLDRVVASNTTRALVLTAHFTEARQRVLAENVANIDTPDYHTKRLDPEAFQKSLKQAFEEGKRDRHKEVHLRGNAQFSTDKSGNVRVEPAKEPAPNVLFHDGTNARIEGLMAAVAKNRVMHQLALNMLKGRYDGVMKAIRGRSS